MSVSIGYGSPRHALVITLCIIPCTASGCSHENALSMRTGAPSSVDEQILGRARPAEHEPRERRVGLHGFAARTAASRTAGPSAGTASGDGIPPGGRSCREATSGSRARGSSGSRSSARRARASRGRRPDCRSRSRARGPTSRSTRSGSSISLIARGDAHLAREPADRRCGNSGDRCRPLRRALGRRVRASSCMRRLDRSARRAA